MTPDAAKRAEHEIAHGKHLAEKAPELLWGWGTPAGKLRAERRARLIGRGAAIGPGQRVLEVGCGSGMFTEMFARSGADIVAVDISPDLIEIARSRELATDRVRFIVRPFEECLEEGPFDAVIGSSVLHHLDLTTALDRIRELLAPGGRMSFAEPNLLNPQVFLERRFRRWFPYVSPDETAFRKRSFARLLERAGFEAIEIEPFDWLHPRVPPALIPAVERIGVLLERIPLLREFAGSLTINARRAQSPSR